MSTVRDAEHAALVVNVASRSGREAYQEARSRLQDGGLALAESRAVESPADIPGAVRGLLRDGADVIVLGGGDGTVSSVAPVLANSHAVLALLPLGTANDFARTLSIPFDLAGACEAVLTGRVVDVDLGAVADRRFVNVTQLGLAVGVTRLLDNRVKKVLGPLAYPVTALRAFAQHRPFTARLEFPDSDADDVELGDLLQLAVGSGVYYGGGNAVSPTAHIDDSHLDIYAIPRGTLKHRWHVLRWFRSGRFVRTGRVFHTQTERVRVHATPAQALNVDGEILEADGDGPWEFCVFRNALRVIVPQDSEAARLDNPG